jgi:hypothetical protein
MWLMPAVGRDHAAIGLRRRIDDRKNVVALVVATPADIHRRVRHVSRHSLRAKTGAQGRNRTTDTCIFSAVLYRLSYLGFSWA